MRTEQHEYLVYARKSTDDADNQKNSLAYQVDEGLRYASSNGLKVARCTEAGFAEGGVIQEKHSGWVTSDLQMTDDGRVSFAIERPKFQRLSQLLRDGKYRGVICLCWDRISRNDHDGLVIKSLMDSGVDFRFVQASYDKSSSGALHRDIDGMFSAHYSRVISEKVRNTFEKFRRDGKCIGPAPLGYLDNGSMSKPLDPVRAPIVRRIFELYATGEWSYSQLADWANKQGLTTKPMRWKRTLKEIARDDSPDRPQVCYPVTRKTIEHILLNPFYIGQHRSNVREQWPCKHPALVDSSLFYKARAMTRTRNVGVHPQDSSFFPYRGMLTCGGCGRSYSPYARKGITYYRVPCRANCVNAVKNLREKDIDTGVATLFDRIRFSDAELAEIEAGASEGLAHVADERNRAMADLETKRKRVFTDLDYLKQNKVTLMRTGAIAPEDYGEDVERLEAELNEVYAQMEVYKDAESDMLRYVLAFSEMVKRAGEYYRDALDTEKHELVTLAFSELSFCSGEFKFVGKDGFSALFSRFGDTKRPQNGLGAFSGSGHVRLSEVIGMYRRARISSEKMAGLNMLKKP